MAVYKQQESKFWWYKFTWNGQSVRRSTKQTNKRVAEQMEAAHKTGLAKGEVGIVEKQPAPTLELFAERFMQAIVSFRQRCVIGCRLGFLFAGRFDSEEQLVPFVMFA